MTLALSRDLLPQFGNRTGVAPASWSIATAMVNEHCLLTRYAASGGVVVAVVFTVGPACQDVDTLTQMLLAGATAARIDLTVSVLWAAVH